MRYEKRVHEAARSVVREGLAESVHDVSDGGLAVAVAESCLGADRMGARLDILTGLTTTHLLFHEAPSRILLAVAEEKVAAVTAAADLQGVEAPVIGETVEGRLEIRVNGSTLLDLAAAVMYETWDSAFEEMVNRA